MAYQRFLKASVMMLAVACVLSVGAGATCDTVSATQCTVCHYTLIIAGSEACCYSYYCSNGSTDSNCTACGYAKMRSLQDRMPTSDGTARTDAHSEETIVLSQLLMRDRQLIRAVNQLAAGGH
jgi:hypothetical protein